MTVDDVKAGFTGAGLPAELVDEVIDAYSEVVRRFALGDYRPEAVEAGRFAEAVFRLLEWRTQSGTYTPLGSTLPSVPTLLTALANVPAISQPEAIRIHIPRTLQLIYDIRNKRDIAHLGDGIDPNLQDSTLVVANMKWVLAELVRLYHSVSPAEAQEMIEDLVTKEVPSIQEIGGYPVILSNLQPREQALLLLYRAGAKGEDLTVLAHHLRVTKKSNLKARLKAMEKDRLVSCPPGSDQWHITYKGERHVETAGIAQPAQI